MTERKRKSGGAIVPVRGNIIDANYRIVRAEPRRIRDVTPKKGVKEQLQGTADWFASRQGFDGFFTLGGEEDEQSSSSSKRKRGSALPEFSADDLISY